MDGRLATWFATRDITRVKFDEKFGPRTQAHSVAAIGAQSREPASAGPASHCASRVWAVVVLFVRFLLRLVFLEDVDGETVVVSFDGENKRSTFSTARPLGLAVPPHHCINSTE